MTPTQIKILFLKKGIKQIEIARRFDVTPGMINGLITHKFKSYRLQRGIAKMLGVDFKKLWEEKEEV